MAGRTNSKVMKTRPTLQHPVPIRQLNSLMAWGHLGETQIYIPGQQLPRAKLRTSRLKRASTNYLSRVGVLKHSMVNAFTINSDDGSKPPHLSPVDIQHRHRSSFFSKLRQCAAHEGGLFGTPIVLGWDHKHFCLEDQPNFSEQNGRYRSLPSIPARFVVDSMGFVTSWVAPPLSDLRSVGNWELECTRFIVFDDAYDNDDDEEDVTGEQPVHSQRSILVRRVGQYVFN